MADQSEIAARLAEPLGTVKRECALVSAPEGKLEHRPHDVYGARTLAERGDIYALGARRVD